MDHAQENREKTPTRGTERVLRQKAQQQMQQQEESSELRKDPAVIYVCSELLGKGCGCAAAPGMSKSGSQEHICRIMLQLM